MRYTHRQYIGHEHGDPQDVRIEISEKNWNVVQNTVSKFFVNFELTLQICFCLSVLYHLSLTIASFYEESISLEIALSVSKFCFDTHWKDFLLNSVQEFNEIEAWLFLTFSICFSCLYVESTNVESTSFPYKAVLPEADVKINSMGSAKWTCHIKTELFQQLLYCFGKFGSRLTNSYKKLIYFVVPTTKMSIFILFMSAGVFLKVSFPSDYP